MIDRCKEQVKGEGQWGWLHPHQCTKKLWKDGFCKIHHPESVAKRQEESLRKWHEKMDNTPLAKALRRIEKLEKENQLLCEEIKTLKEAT